MKTTLFALLLFAAIPTMAQSAPDSDVEEMTYEDLVDALAARQKRFEPREKSAFDDVRIHAGLGMVNSFSNFRLLGKNAARYQNGMQLSIGVDLFSPNWFSEAAWRNFGLTTHGPEEHTLRELDLKLGYRDIMEGQWSYRIQGGLANRMLKLSDPTRGLSIDEVTPGFVGGLGASLEMNRSTSLNFDLSGRAPVVGDAVDQGGFDLTIDLKVSL